MSIAIGMGFFCSETFRSIIDFLLCAWLFWISFGCSRYYLVVPDIMQASRYSRLRPQQDLGLPPATDSKEPQCFQKVKKGCCQGGQILLKFLRAGFSLGLSRPTAGSGAAHMRQNSSGTRVLSSFLLHSASAAVSFLLILKCC